MEDYERQNSRAWDAELKDVPHPVRAGEFTWTHQPDQGAIPPLQQSSRVTSTPSLTPTAPRARSTLPSAPQPPLPRPPRLQNCGPATVANGRQPIPAPSLQPGTHGAVVACQQSPRREPLETSSSRLLQASDSRPPTSDYGSPPVPLASRAAAPYRAQKPWQSSRGLPLKRSEPPKFRRIGTTQDNAGSKAWRARKPPKETVSVPSATAAHFHEHLADLAQETGCYLEVAKTGSLGLWGELEKVREAKSRIESALGNERGLVKASFAKLHSLTPALTKRAEHRFRNAVKRSRYRQIPPWGTAFDVIGIFHWPSKEYTPEDVLGPSFEALDPVRMDCECYINYHPEINSFEVLGELKGVQDALLRVRKACFQLTAHSINSVRLALTHWRSALVPSHVALEEYPGPRVIAPASGELKHVNHSPRGEGNIENAKELEDALTRSTLNVERIKATFADALRKVHYYTGAITMVIRLGTFLLDQYMPPVDGMYELQEWEDMTKQSQFRGEVTEELGHVVTSSDGVLSIVQAANELLRPQDAMADDLRNVRPRFSAVFVFEDEVGDLRLVKSWHVDEDAEGFANELVEEQDRWTRLDRDTGKANYLVNMALTDLHTGGAWQFDITAAHAVDEDKIERVYTNFAKGVGMQLGTALEFGDACFVSWKSIIPVKAMRQEVHYLYNIRKTDYSLDLVRFQNREFPAGQSRVRDLPPKTFESCWGLSISRADWGTKFSKNERLPIGTHASWQDDMETWFPPFTYNDTDGVDGFLQLVDKLGCIEKLFHAKIEHGLQSAGSQTSLDAATKTTSSYGNEYYN